MRYGEGVQQRRRRLLSTLTLAAVKGDVYVGDWKGDRRNGQGRHTTRSAPDAGGRYEGHWAGGVKSGHGTYKSADGVVYQGQYKHDRQEGWGVLAYPTGDLFDGHGTMHWVAGARYEGQWKAGEYHGMGAFTWADGSQYQGDWEKGQPQQGVNFSPNGLVRSFQRVDVMQFHRLLAGWPQHKTLEYVECLKAARQGDTKMQAIADFTFGQGWEKKCGLE